MLEDVIENLKITKYLAGSLNTALDQESPMNGVVMSSYQKK